MEKFEEKLLADKKRYIDYINQNRDKFDHIFVYGAGRMAKPFAQFLKENGILIDAFCVSDRSLNRKAELGIPILQIDDLKVNRERTVFLLGVNPRLNSEVSAILQKHGYSNVIHSTEYIRYYGKYQYDFYMNPMIEITTRTGCVINCKFCPQKSFLKNYFQTGNEDKIMRFETFKKCIDKTPDNTIVEFAGFTEPFLNPECIKMLEYAKEKGRKINLFTTLVGVKKEMLPMIRDIEYGEFVLHVPDVEEYAKIPITEEYLELLDFVVKAEKPSGMPLVDYACSQGEIPLLIKRYLGDDIRIFISLLDRAGNLEDEHLYRKRNIRGQICCDVSKTINHNVLLPDGRLVLCAQDYGMRHVLGNLLEESYEDIINGDVAKNVVSCMNHSDDTNVLCRNCSLARQI